MVRPHATADSGQTHVVRRILGYALLPVLVVLALPSVVRLFGDHGWAPLVLLDVITPYVLPLLVALLVAFAILNRSILTGVAGVLVIINILWLLPLFVGSSAGQGETLTVVTANLHVGRADPVALVELLRRQHADVLAAEELTPTEMTALDRAGLKALMPYRSLTPSTGAAGNGLYSRFPMTKHSPWQLTFRAPGATIHVNGQDVLVRVVHAYPPVPWRPGASSHDWTSIDKALGELPKGTPVIVAGDFNASRDVWGLRSVMRHGLRDASEVAGSGFLRTWGPPHLPALFQLDHVLVSSRVGVRSTAVVDLPGSDHQALVAHLVLRAA